MTATPDCPRCKKPLAVPQEDGTLRCEACRGAFVQGTQLHRELLEEAAPASGGAPLVCPGCGDPMETVDVGGAAVDRCTSCGGVWLDAGEDLCAKAGLGRLLVYSLTLPERALRSVIGLGAGAVKEMAEFIVPQAFQDAQTYRIVIRNSLKFLTEDVGGVAVEAGAEETPRDFVARKTLGNFLDLAGMATLHVSPLWLLAIVSDLSHGTKTYVHELADELKARGVIDDASVIHGVDGVLEAMMDASGRTAALFDTPPLSVDQLRETLVEVRSAVASANYASLIPAAEVKALWEEMRAVAAAEDLSLLEVSAGVTMRGLDRLGALSTGTLAGIRVAGGLVGRHVIGHYAESLREIRERGFFPTLKDSYAPYAEAVWKNFAGSRATLTEDVVTGRLLGKALRKLGGWLGRPAPEE